MASTEGVNIIISGDSSKLIQSVKEAQNALGNIKSQKIDIALNITNSLNEAGAKIESLFGGIFKTITAGAMSVAGALGMVTKSALSIGGGFEAQITNVRVISGATEQELDMLIKKAREMGATLPITAKDAATAMQMLAQRGTSARDILASVSEVANLTISQGVDMGSAADLLGSTMTNFGINIEDAAKVTAIFNNACNQSALSMSKLIEAMKYVGPAAGAVGMDLTEAVSGMEAIANAGLTGEMTGTGLAMVLSKLAATTKIMGVNVKEADGSLRPLYDIFTDLKDAGFSLTEAIKAFGQRGSKAALALAKNSESLETNRKRLEQWGSTQYAVDTKAKTFTNTMAALQSAIEELHIEIFEQIKDQSKQAVGGMAELTRAFSEWVGETKIAGKALDSFLDGLGLKIPSGSDFKALLNQLDVQPFIDKIHEFGATLKSIGESIAAFFNKIKTPLSWLIEHLDTFATISFWGWILGKGLQVPAAILGIASSFTVLTGAAKTLFALSWPLLANPIGAALATAGVISGAAFYAYNKAAEAKREEKRIKAEAERIRREVDEANQDLQFHVDIDFKTGFEELPSSFAKASAEVRQEVKENVAFLQEQFRDKAAQAVEYVTAKFPEMSEAFSGTANDISDDILTKISAALRGSEKDFEALPEIWRKVAERINALDNDFDKLGIDLLAISEKYDNLRQLIAKPIDKSQGLSVSDEFSASVDGLTERLTQEVERARNFLNSPNGELSVKVSLAKAQDSIMAFVKSASKDFGIPKEFIKEVVINRLNDLGQKGNQAAESIANSFKEATHSMDVFLADAKIAVNYLGASPEKFLPALNSMINGIQRIDPITGKVTEKFKKARDALKEWSSFTFDNLSKRIKDLQNAVKGGFIDKSVLEREFQRVLPQIKLQVVSELQPLREQYSNASDFQAVVASDFMSRVSDLFGDLGINLARKMFSNQTGANMGYGIIAEVERSLPGASATFNINGIDKLQQGLDSIAGIPQNISNAVSPYVAKLEQLNSHHETTSGSPSAISDYASNFASVIMEIQAASQANVSAINSVEAAIKSQTHQDYSAPDTATLTQAFSSTLSPVVSALQNLSAELDSVQNIAQSNLQAVNDVVSAVNSQQSDKISVNESTITQAVISGFSPLISRIEQNSNVYQSSSDTVAKNIQQLGSNIEALRKSADSSNSAMTQLQASVKAAGDSYNAANITNAITPLTGVVQTLAATLNAIQNTNQATGTAMLDLIQSVRSLENILKSLEAGNNYDIDIIQQGFSVEKKSDADTLARSTVAALKSGLGNGGL